MEIGGPGGLASLPPILTAMTLLAGRPLATNLSRLDLSTLPTISPPMRLVVLNTAGTSITAIAEGSTATRIATATVPAPVIVTATAVMPEELSQ